jgi:hypothetical protein
MNPAGAVSANSLGIHRTDRDRPEIYRCSFELRTSRDGGSVALDACLAVPEISDFDYCWPAHRWRCRAGTVSEAPAAEFYPAKHRLLADGDTRTVLSRPRVCWWSFYRRVETGMTETMPLCRRRSIRMELSSRGNVMYPTFSELEGRNERSNLSDRINCGNYVRFVVSRSSLR